MANQLPSGRWRGRVRHPRTGKQVAPHTVIGGPSTFPSQRLAEQAESRARDVLVGDARRGLTVREWWEEWTTDPLWLRPAESTNIHNRERTAGFVALYGDRAMAAVDHLVVGEWLKGGRNTGAVPALRAMWNDARRPHAGMLIDYNPFANLGLRGRRGRKNVQPPNEIQVGRMIEVADAMTPPSFAAYILTACWTAARPGELDALRWTDLDFEAEEIRIERQWNVKARKLSLPKHDSRRTIAMTEVVHDRLIDLPRESEWVFTTLRGTHYMPSSRCFHWNRVRCSAGLGDVDLYTATRHFYGWYALNVLDLQPHVIALHLGHTDGGRLVRELYGHPDAAIARERIREAFRSTGQTKATPRLRIVS